MRNILVKFSPERVRTDGGGGGGVEQNQNKCWELLWQIRPRCFSPLLHTKKHCLHIIKGGKDNKTFQNSFLIFFTADNKVFSCFFSVQY